MIRGTGHKHSGEREVAGEITKRFMLKSHPFLGHLRSVHYPAKTVRVAKFALMEAIEEFEAGDAFEAVELLEHWPPRLF